MSSFWFAIVGLSSRVVQDRDELAHARDDRHFRFFAFGLQMLIKCLDLFVVTNRDDKSLCRDHDEPGRDLARARSFIIMFAEMDRNRYDIRPEWH